MPWSSFGGIIVVSRLVVYLQHLPTIPAGAHQQRADSEGILQ